MTASFNLLDEDWIKVTLVAGGTAELSLQQVFERATEIRALSGELASQDFALLRFLLAISHRALAGPKSLDAWQRYWEDPAAFKAKACEYLSVHRDRFDLRHPSHPFYQVAGIHSSSGAISGLEKLIADVPNGSQFFTTRRKAGVASISWAEAARWLVHVQACDPSGIRTGAVGDPAVKGGKGYPIGPGWTGQIGGLFIQGDNLAETLLLNTVVCGSVSDLSEVDPEHDLPPWERPADGPAGAESLVPTGPVACYTWQTRRVLLHGDEDWVTGLFLGNGNKATPQNRYSVEPMTAWRFSKPQTAKLGTRTYMPRKHSTTQAFWRGLPSILPKLAVEVTSKDYPPFMSPGIVEFYERLMAEGLIPLKALVDLKAVGLEYGSQEAVIDDLVEDSLQIPAKLLPADSPLLSRVKDAMSDADHTAMAVRSLGANLERASGGDPDRVSAAGERARAAIYAMLDHEFPRWLAGLATADALEAVDDWRRFLHKVAAQQRDFLVSALPATAFAGRGSGSNQMDVSQALLFFQASMRKGVPDPDSNTNPKPNEERTGA